MNVSEAVATRRSVRAYTDQPVSPEVLREVLANAARAPSGGNLQPWRIYALAGEPLTELKAAIRLRLRTRPTPPKPEYAVYPPSLSEPYRNQRFAIGEAMYALLGIPRENKLGRLQWIQNNFDFFGAPVGLMCFIDRQMGPPQWSDLGMYLQTVMLLLREHGLDSCAQEAWSLYHDTVREVLAPPDELMLFCGMAIGYADHAVPLDRLQSERAPLDAFATLRGC
jgi:nitroreductase